MEGWKWVGGPREWMLKAPASWEDLHIAWRGCERAGHSVKGMEGL